MTFSDWISVAGLLVGVVGFAVTISLVVKAKSAAEAAQDAVELTRTEIVRKLLLALGPGLVQIEGHLERSIQKDDHERTVEALVDWRAKANELAGLIRTHGDGGESLAARLQKTVALAVTAKEAIATRPDVDRWRATVSVRSEIASVVSDVQVFAAESISTTEGQQS